MLHVHVSAPGSVKFHATVTLFEPSATGTTGNVIDGTVISGPAFVTPTEALAFRLSPPSLSFAFTATLIVAGPSVAAQEPELVVEYADHVVPLSHENAYWKAAVTSGVDGSVTFVAENVNSVGPSTTEVGAVTPVTVGMTLLTVTDVVTGSLSALSLSFALTA